jgi:hypothetical protein
VALAAVVAAQAVAEEHGRPSRHKFEVGVAVTHTEHDETAFTLAASYGYRVSPALSIGVLGEYAFDPLDLWVVGVPVRYFTGQRWVLTAMPGVEIHHSHTESLFRLGVGYEIEKEGYTVTPEVNFDWVNDEVSIVAGVMFGF